MATNPWPVTQATKKNCGEKENAGMRMRTHFPRLSIEGGRRWEEKIILFVNVSFIALSGVT